MPDATTLYNHPQASERITNLHAELAHAMQVARHAEVEPRLRFMKLPQRAQWGLAFVDFYGPERSLYEPSPTGTPALLTAIVEGGDTIDLCAIGLPGQHVATRLGVGRGLGLDAIADARQGCCDLHLVERPLQWLRDPWSGDGGTERNASLYLFRLSDARVLLDGVPEFTCSSFEFAERVRLLFPPSQRDRVLVTA